MGRKPSKRKIENLGNGMFTLTCKTKLELKKVRTSMAFQGFLPMEIYEHSYDEKERKNGKNKVSTQYILVYNIFSKFPNIFFN